MFAMELAYAVWTTVALNKNDVFMMLKNLFEADELQSQN